MIADVAPKIPANVIPKGPPPKVSGKPLDLMKYTLRALILAQEAYAAETNFMTYADNVGKLKEMPRYPGVRVMISNASANGYLAVATHDNLPGASCALSVGPAPMVAPAKEKGVIACEKP